MPVWLIVDICQSSSDFSQTLPFRVVLWGVISHLWAMTISAISTKHAIKTNNNNAAAEFLRYNLGMVALVSSWLSVCALISAHNDPFSVVSIAIPTLIAQFTLDFIVYCTNAKSTQVGLGGISDQLVIGFVLHAFAFADEGSN